MTEKYIEYRLLSGQKPSLNSGLAYFLKFCATKGDKITQEAVDEWFVKKESESPISYQTRFYHALSFIKHANERKWIKVIEPKRPKPAKSVYVPHMMTQTELKNFFDSCDSMKPTPYHKMSRKMIQRQKLTSIIVPVQIHHLNPKRFTQTRIQRILVYALLNITQKDIMNTHLCYMTQCLICLSTMTEKWTKKSQTEK